MSVTIVQAPEVLLPAPATRRLMALVSTEAIMAVVLIRVCTLARTRGRCQKGFVERILSKTLKLRLFLDHVDSSLKAYKSPINKSLAPFVKAGNLYLSGSSE